MSFDECGGHGGGGPGGSPIYDSSDEGGAAVEHLLQLKQTLADASALLESQLRETKRLHTESVTLKAENKSLRQQLGRCQHDRDDERLPSHVSEDSNILPGRPGEASGVASVASSSSAAPVAAPVSVDKLLEQQVQELAAGAPVADSDASGAAVPPGPPPTSDVRPPSTLPPRSISPPAPGGAPDALKQEEFGLVLAVVPGAVADANPQETCEPPPPLAEAQPKDDKSKKTREIPQHGRVRHSGKLAINGVERKADQRNGGRMPSKGSSNGSNLHVPPALDLVPEQEEESAAPPRDPSGFSDLMPMPLALSASDGQRGRSPERTNQHHFSWSSRPRSPMADVRMQSNSSPPSDGDRSDLAHRVTMVMQGAIMHGHSRPQMQKVKTKGLGKGLFGDAEAMKEKVRQNVCKPEYTVTMYYWEEGISQMIARHPRFDHLALSVIVFNAFWMYIDADFNDKDLLIEAKLHFQVMEHFFCSFFVLEWLIRFCAFRSKRDCLRDYWFVFDSWLALLMVLETWIIGVALRGGSNGAFGNASALKLIRLIRLTRLARMAKLLRAIPELMILVKGMGVAMKAVLTTLALLLLIIYVFAIAFTQLAKGTKLERKLFGSVPTSISTLLLTGTVPDLQSMVQEDLGGEHVMLAVLFLVFIWLSTFTVLNMLVGILVEVVGVVSSVEKETMEVTYVKDQLLGLLELSEIDANKDNLISKAEFEGLLENREAVLALNAIGVDVISLVDFTDFIFLDESGEETDLSFGRFMEVILQLRGQNKATVKDLVDMRKFVVSEVGRSEERLTKWLDDHLLPPVRQTLQEVSGVKPAMWPS